MQIESKDLKDKLFSLKQEALISLDRTSKNKVRSIIETRISVIDYILTWIHQSEQKGEMNMEEIKLGELVRWEPKPRKGSVDTLIVEAAQRLKKNYDAIKITVDTVSWNTLANRTYKLRGEDKIKNNIVPRKDADGSQYLVFLDEPNPKRSKAKV